MGGCTVKHCTAILLSQPPRLESVRYDSGLNMEEACIGLMLTHSRYGVACTAVAATGVRHHKRLVAYVKP